MKRVTSKTERGQSMVESTLVLLVFFALLLGVIDCGQLLFARQSLVERVRTAVRWGVVHPWDGADPIVNLVLYDHPEMPRVDAPSFLGMKRENVLVHHIAPSERPEDETLNVTIVNFRSQLFSPWFAQTLVSARAVSITAPMASRQPSGSARIYPQP